MLTRENNGGSSGSPCCGNTPQEIKLISQPDGDWTAGSPTTPAGDIPIVSTSLSGRDVIGSWKARWGIKRMNYKVVPGLYGVGRPDDSSPVLVSANYKMSFDRLRKELSGIDAWILVIDTKGINVWCAAGKGTFSTDEIVRMVALTGLAAVVSHRKLILPQLGAPGVAAHEVLKRSGFKVTYGPVRGQRPSPVSPGGDEGFSRNAYCQIHAV